ncbi:MAG TPA: GFA family protein [Caulobacterales bacterium]|nr:GFA family protein [Caulobacterales bacterium]
MPRPPLPSPPYLGGCLCGAVRYGYNARPLGLNACHCGHCKKLSGSDYIKMLLGERAHFTHNGATAIYRNTAESGRQIDIHRCAQCGTRLWHEPLSAPQFVFVCAGTLDDVGWTTPTSHIWVELADAAAGFASDAVKLEGQPKDRAALFEAFNRAYPP